MNLKTSINRGTINFILRNRGFIISCILGGILGALIAYMGFPITTWQWWAIMFVANGMMVNGSLS